MPKQYVQTIGYGGPKPLAIIFWYKPCDDEPSYKTVCYDEQDVMTMYERHKTPGDFYNKLRPSIHLIEGATACAMVS